MQNIEIKARCADLADAARKASRMGAVLEWTTLQTDTYYPTSAGRLKLRHCEGRNDELIFYRRPDENLPKVSQYQVVTIAPAQAVDHMLADALGVKAIVHKRRQLWRLDNVRIHLDEVDGLGCFIEIEVEVTSDRDLEGCRRQANAMLEELGISPTDLIAGSYSDMVTRL